jgi:hypothetical protein
MIADIAIFNGATDKQHARSSAPSSADVGPGPARRRGALRRRRDRRHPSSSAARPARRSTCAARPKLACVAQDTNDVSTLAKRQGGDRPDLPAVLLRGARPTSRAACPRATSTPARSPTPTPTATAIANADDNCPNVFNPPMQIVDGQLDADDDGVGDACDACPLEAGDGCVVLDADDIDDDGVPNGSSTTARATQRQPGRRRHDGHGDACDSCAEPNPGPALCPTTIPDDPQPDGPRTTRWSATRSRSRGAYVTAVRPNTATRAASTSRTTRPRAWNGIFVFTGGKRAGRRGRQPGRRRAAPTRSSTASARSRARCPDRRPRRGPAVRADPARPGDPRHRQAQRRALRVDAGPRRPGRITDQNSDAPMDFDEFTSPATCASTTRSPTASRTWASTTRARSPPSSTTSSASASASASPTRSCREAQKIRRVREPPRSKADVVAPRAGGGRAAGAASAAVRRAAVDPGPAHERRAAARRLGRGRAAGAAAVRIHGRARRRR